jgi:thiol-disulfide isomerase/thioredoxin
MKKKMLISILFIMIGSMAFSQFSLTSKLRILRPVNIALYDLAGNAVFRDSLKQNIKFQTPSIQLKADLYKFVLGDYEQYILLSNKPIVLKGIYVNAKNNTMEFEGDTTIQNLELAELKFKKTSGNWKFDLVKDSFDPLVIISLIYKNESFFNTKGEELNAFRPKITEELKQTKVGTHVMKFIDKTSAQHVGALVNDFELPDVNEKTHKLSDFKGKYVLLDFWASWCGPCKVEMKHLKEIYDELKSDKIVFISISLDDDKEKWHQALPTVEIPWVSLWNPTGMKNSKFITEFGFNQIPFIVFISPDGRIIAKGLRGDEVKHTILKHIK